MFTPEQGQLLKQKLWPSDNSTNEFVPQLPQASMETTPVPQPGMDLGGIASRVAGVEHRAIDAVGNHIPAAKGIALGVDALSAVAPYVANQVAEGVKNIPSNLANTAHYIATGEDAPTRTPASADNPTQGNPMFTPGAPAQAPGALGFDQGTPNPFKLNTGGYDTAIKGYQDLGKAQTQAYNDMAIQQAAIQKDRDAQLLAQKARIDDYNVKMNQSYEDYAKKNISIDNMWADKGTGSKILAGLGIVLGGIGQMQGQKTNVGLDVVNKAIDQDLQIQRANLEHAGRAAEMQRGILSDQMKNFNDLDTATIASKMLGLQQIEDKLKANSANPQAQVMVGQLQTEKAKLGMQMQMMAQKINMPQQIQNQNEEQVDNLRAQVKNLNIGAKMPFSEAGQKADEINAQIFNLVALSGISPRIARESAKAYFVTAKDLTDPHAVDSKMNALKQQLRMAAVNKKNTPNVADTGDEGQ